MNHKAVLNFIQHPVCSKELVQGRARTLVSLPRVMVKNTMGVITDYFLLKMGSQLRDNWYPCVWCPSAIALAGAEFKTRFVVRGQLLAKIAWYDYEIFRLIVLQTDLFNRCQNNIELYSFYMAFKEDISKMWIFCKFYNYD